MWHSKFRNWFFFNSFDQCVMDSCFETFTTSMLKNKIKTRLTTCNKNLWYIFIYLSCLIHSWMGYVVICRYLFSLLPRIDIWHGYLIFFKHEMVRKIGHDLLTIYRLLFISNPLSCKDFSIDGVFFSGLLRLL